jgi:glycosyltransferase involved in cell wall biosynthesis
MPTRSSSPRILFVAGAWAFGRAFGAQLRCLNVLRALAQIGAVEVVMLGDPGGAINAISEAGHNISGAYFLETTQPTPEKGLAGKLKWTFDPRVDYPFGQRVGEEGVHRLVRSAEEFDLIWFFRQLSADMFPNRAWQRSVIDIDDVQSTYECAALRMGGLPERLSTLRRVFVWRRRERLLGDRFSVLAVCNEEDKQYLRRLGVDAHVHVIPNGYEKPSVEPVRSPAAPPRVGFIGAFDYLPNREGVSWFVKKCWPHVKRQVPRARLRLIGRNGDLFRELDGPDVDRLGALPDPSDEIKTWCAMVVPIRLGSGTCVKIAHGFSEKCPIVSTTFGARGYGAVDGREMYLADSAEAFANACIKAICEPEEAAQVAHRAWIGFLRNWTWDAIRPRVWAAAEDCLRSSVNSGSIVEEARCRA